MIAADFTYRAIRTGARPAWCDRRDETWLAKAELATYRGLRDSRRRHEWLWGRWLAKQVVLERLATRPAQDVVRRSDIQIVSRDQRGKPMQPRITVGDQALDWSLTISHSSNIVSVALSCTSGVTVGVDVTPLVAPTAGFLNMWFTPRERAWAQRQDDKFAVATVWAVKEAAYKAWQRNVPFAPRKLETRPQCRGRFQCAYDGCDLPYRHEIRTRRWDQEVIALALFDHRRTLAAPQAASGIHQHRAAVEPHCFTQVGWDNNVPLLCQ